MSQSTCQIRDDDRLGNPSRDGQAEQSRISIARSKSVRPWAVHARVLGAWRKRLQVEARKDAHCPGMAGPNTSVGEPAEAGGVAPPLPDVHITIEMTPYLSGGGCRVAFLWTHTPFPRGAHGSALWGVTHFFPFLQNLVELLKLRGFDSHGGEFPSTWYISGTGVPFRMSARFFVPGVKRF